MNTTLNKCLGLPSLTTVRNTLLASSFWIAGALQPSSGETIYSANFEPPTFADNVALFLQDGWNAPPALSPAAAVVTNDKPRQGKQTVRVKGTDLVAEEFINQATSGYYAAIGSYRRPVNYDTGGTQTVRISAHVRIDGPQSSAGDNFYSAGISGRVATTFEGGPSNASVGELVISSDGNAYAYSGNDLVPTILASVPVTLGEWHDLAVVADFANQTSDFYVDGQLLTTIAWDPLEVSTGVLLRGTLHAYAAPDTATEEKADYASTYDKFSIKATGK
ncbi:MAG: hypothetical protein V4819_20820 [Verrucomicrobiota bacterium]